MAEYEVVLDRQWKMIQALSTDPNGLTLEEMASRFECSEKTIKRDLKSIESVFGELKTRFEAHGRKRYYNDRALFNYGLGLEPNELLAFYIGQKLMEPLRGTYFWEDVKSGCDKIAKILRKDAVDYAERVAPFFYRFEPIERRVNKQLGDLVEVVTKALSESRVLEVRYRSLKSRRAKSYEVCPYNFVYWRSSAYFIGLCLHDKKVKFWKVDRLADARIVHNKRFKRPADFDVNEYMSNVVAPFVGEAPVARVVLRFTGYAARIIQEEQPRNVDSIAEQPDGSVILEMTTELGKTFARWLMQYGVHAEILAPTELRELFVQELRDLQEMYAASGSAPVAYYDTLVRANAPGAALEALEEAADEVDGESPETYDVEILVDSEESSDAKSESKSAAPVPRKDEPVPMEDAEEEPVAADLAEEDVAELEPPAVERVPKAPKPSEPPQLKANKTPEPPRIVRSAVAPAKPTAAPPRDARPAVVPAKPAPEPSVKEPERRPEEKAPEPRRKIRRLKPITGKEMLAKLKGRRG